MGVAVRCHLQNLQIWRPDPRVLRKLDGTGFEFWDKLFSENQKTSTGNDCELLAVLLQYYHVEDRCFAFNGLKLCFSVKDVLYITGLPIDGKPVTGKDSNPSDLVKRLLGIETSLKPKCAAVKLTWLRNNFAEVPPHIDGESTELQLYVRAYVLYILGSVVLPDGSGNTVPLIYLSLMERIEDLKEYAWGAALLAHLHIAMGKFKEGKIKALEGQCYALMIFIMEYIPKIACLFGVEDDINRPNDFPLMVQWSPIIQRKLKNTHDQTGTNKYPGILQRLKDLHIEWQPYARLPRPIPSPAYIGQEDISCAHTILICYEKAVYHMPHVSPKQFGFEKVPPFERNPTQLCKLGTRVGSKVLDRDWASFENYKSYNQAWKDRRKFLMVSEEVGQPMAHGVFQPHILVDEECENRTQAISSSFLPFYSDEALSSYLAGVLVESSTLSTRRKDAETTNKNPIIQPFDTFI